MVVCALLPSSLRSQVAAAVQYQPSAVPAENIRNLVSEVRTAAARGALAIVLPEHAITGPLPAAPSAEEEEVLLMAAAQAERRFQFLAKELVVWIALTIPRSSADGKSIVLTTLLFDGYGHEVVRQGKLNPQPGSGDGPAIPGSMAEVLTSDVAGNRIGVSSGGDLPVTVPRLAQLGAKTILVSSSWCRDANATWLPAASKLARENGVNLIIGNWTTSGTPACGAAVISRTGAVVSRIGPADGGVLVSSLPRTHTAAPPLGLPPDPLPPLALRSTAAIALGQKLFFDGGLSGDGRTSCAHCHIPEKGFADNRKTEEGVFGRHGRLNTASLLNVAYRAFLSDDGATSSLLDRVKHGFGNPQEMDMAPGDVARYIQGQPEYVRAFRATYGDSAITFDRALECLTAFVQTLTAGGSRADRFLFLGELDALNASAMRGFHLFVGKAGCAGCHTIGKDNALLSDNRLHNTGVGFAEVAPGGPASANDSGPVKGRYLTPILRNVALTAPYMHDGSLATLEDVVDYYNRGGNPNPFLDPLVRPLGLSSVERQDLVAFLNSLTGYARQNPASLRRADNKNQRTPQSSHKGDSLPVSHTANLKSLDYHGR